jgi:type IV secretion system protein VirD4
VCSINRKKLISLLLILPIALAALLYGGGFMAQFIYNYDVWQAGGAAFGTAPQFPNANFFACIAAVFRWPSGLYGLGSCVAALAALTFGVLHMGQGEGGELDKARNLMYSDKGTYGTAGFLSKREMKDVLDLVPNIRKHPGIILGELDGQVVCVPLKTRFNGNLAVYGASGSKKTRAFCVNMILQSVARKSSLVICDPKSELYEKTSEYLRDQGYTVKVFNLVTPAASDSWNCLSEIEGQELMAQLFCDVIIKNTGSGRGDHFWDNAELNLLKALVLYVEQGYPEGRRTIGEVYQLLAMSSEKELNALFDVLPISHPAKAPYSIFKQSSESVRGGVIIGLGSRLQVFQNQDIRNITGYDEIDLELPGKQPCAYFCITSDQDSTFDFLSSLFLSFIFIKLVRYADQNCPGGALPVPVHVLGEELCACGVIPDLSRKISVIRSRNISMSCVFQNLAGLQNRYPDNQWQEILGNCDITLFLGCTDALTATFISDRTGEASIAVTSKGRQLSSWQVTNYTPLYRETSGVGKRKLMTMDEVLRMDVDRALVILRGKKVLEVDKYDYSKHPEAKKLRAGKASSHVPAWQEAQKQTRAAAKKEVKPAPAQSAAVPKKEPASEPAPAKQAAHEAAPRVKSTSKDSIIKPKPKKED